MVYNEKISFSTHFEFNHIGNVIDQYGIPIKQANIDVMDKFAVLKLKCCYNNAVATAAAVVCSWAIIS